MKLQDTTALYNWGIFSDESSEDLTEEEKIEYDSEACASDDERIESIYDNVEFIPINDPKPSTFNNDLPSDWQGMEIPQWNP
jgi:hypothetical protein